MTGRTKYPSALNPAADPDRNGWERGVSKILWARFGVHRIGLDDLLATHKANGLTPQKAAEMIQLQFGLTPLEGSE